RGDAAESRDARRRCPQGRIVARRADSRMAAPRTIPAARAPGRNRPSSAGLGGGKIVDEVARRGRGELVVDLDVLAIKLREVQRERFRGAVAAAGNAVATDHHVAEDVLLEGV